MNKTNFLNNIFCTWRRRKGGDHASHVRVRVVLHDEIGAERDTGDVSETRAFDGSEEATVQRYD